MIGRTVHGSEMHGPFCCENANAEQSVIFSFAKMER